MMESLLFIVTVLAGLTIKGGLANFWGNVSIHNYFLHEDLEDKDVYDNNWSYLQTLIKQMGKEDVITPKVLLVVSELAYQPITGVYGGTQFIVFKNEVDQSCVAYVDWDTTGGNIFCSIVKVPQTKKIWSKVELAINFAAVVLHALLDFWRNIHYPNSPEPTPSHPHLLPLPNESLLQVGESLPQHTRPS